MDCNKDGKKTKGKKEKSSSCPDYNPEICKYIDTPRICAFVRSDKKCKKPGQNKNRGSAKRGVK